LNPRYFGIKGTGVSVEYRVSNLLDNESEWIIENPFDCMNIVSDGISKWFIT
jgi:hypothetical protein